MVDPPVGGTQYRYVIPVDPIELTSRWDLFDAWHINEVGEKDPEMLHPSPVARRELIDIDFSPHEVRRPLYDFSRGRVQTFVFMLGGAEPSDDAFHVRALGVGVNAASASRDAAHRLMARYPGLRSPKTRFGPELQHPASLLEALLSGNAAVLASTPGDYPKQEQMGHEYMSNETYQIAHALQSRSEVAALVASLPHGTIAEKTDAIRVHVNSLVRSMQLRLDLVDWSEVLSGFSSEDEAEGQRPADFAPDQSVSYESVAKGGTNKARSIDADILDVLRRSTVKGRELRLPSEKLSPQLYRRVNDVLLALGGKWVGRKIQAHVFEEEAGPVIEVALATGAFIHPKDFGYFPTPATLVQQLIDKAEIEPGMRVLEPSAGRAAIAASLAEAAGGQDNVTVCEFLPRNVSKLQEKGFTQIVQGDFLAMEPEPIFDRVVMNPPFSGGADIEHVMHAARFLKPDGRLVAITSPAWTTHQNRKSEAFRSFVEEVGGEVSSIERGAFKESGTDIETRMVVMEAANFPWNRETLQNRERVRG